MLVTYSDWYTELQQTGNKRAVEINAFQSGTGIKTECKKPLGLDIWPVPADTWALKTISWVRVRMGCPNMFRSTRNSDLNVTTISLLTDVSPLIPTLEPQNLYIINLQRQRS